MSNWLTSLMLGAYRNTGKMLYPFMGPFLSLRARGGKEDRRRRYERYGYPSADKPVGPLVWFHAASVGESLAVLGLIQRVHQLGINTILTTGTVTSAEVIRKRLPRQTFHQYVPLDLQPAVGRFLDHWQPDLAVFTESELWPMTIAELKSRQIPQVLVNARMSDRSYKRWAGASNVAESLCDKFSHVVAQSELDAERFRSLGASPVTISGNLKVDTPELPVNHEELQRLRAFIGQRPVWIGASTHKGEDEILVKVHQQLRSQFPGLLTIIVPRHPERAEEIKTFVDQFRLPSARRSKKQDITAATEIYIGDTIGEMGLYLRLGQVVFMGRSLKVRGGQNPLEPAMTGTAVLSGKHVLNFRDSYSALLKNGGVRLVRDGAMLRDNLAFLLAHPQEREKMIESARQTVHSMRGALEKTIDVLDTYVFPLTVERYLGDGTNDQ